MSFQYTDEAIRDVSDILDYIAKENPAAAHEVSQAIEVTVDLQQRRKSATRVVRGRGKGIPQVWYNGIMNERLKELVASMEDWPEGAQSEAIASLEAIAGFVSLYEPSSGDL